MASDPALRDAIRGRLRRLDETRFSERLWRRDATLWKDDDEHRRLIENSLGWLALADAMEGRAGDLHGFAAQVAADGYRDAVLLGMGGSSLAPEVLHAMFATADGYLDLHVLDSTDPAAVRALEESVDLETALFIVSSKSGGTIETACLHAYFLDRLRSLDADDAGRHFVAITDPGTSLRDQALEQGFRAVFLNPADIGGRYSALSYFGLVPAALAGVDVGRLLERARHVAAVCGPDVAAHENPAIKLGAAIGELARGGRDKLTLVASPGVAPFGAWLEQLIAESTGKEGVGIVPVDGETLGGPDVYGDDRAFVYLRLADEDDVHNQEVLHELAEAGLPVMSLVLTDLYDIGGEFLRWEIATATAGAVLGIDPFDQPNVQESKDNTGRLLAEHVSGGRLPELADDEGRASAFIGDDSFAFALRDLLRTLAPGDYFALQAYLPPGEQVSRILQGTRMLVRDRFRVATSVGYGPRFLHSTGQLHKGGPTTGVFLQLTCGEPRGDVEIPGRPYSFGVLKRAQARGDLEALRGRGLRALNIDLGKDPLPGLTTLGKALAAMLRG